MFRNSYNASGSHLIAASNYFFLFSDMSAADIFFVDVLCFVLNNNVYLHSVYSH